jgi:hypothetical protein
MKLVSAILLLLATALPASAQWSFVVAGDSRNCGDVVMPAIAEGAKLHKAAFYWHLGDLRLIYDFDQDIAREASNADDKLEISGYLRKAWPDFIQHQIAPFEAAGVPFFIAIGNHEVVSPKTRNEFELQFADWLMQPVITKQRLADDPKDHQLRTYYHWIENGVDFITLDNATPDMFDDAQVKWLERVLAADAKNAAVKTVVVGMHAALPHSLACGHSMDSYPQQEASGTRVYKDLLKFQAGGKRIYVLASHSHFVMSDIYNSEFWKNNGGVLPGWIIGTAGAQRYRLPPTASQAAMAETDVYGYLLGTVAPSGEITFDFRKLSIDDIPPSVVHHYTYHFVDQCFRENKSMTAGEPVDCDRNVQCGGQRAAGSE